MEFLKDFSDDDEDDTVEISRRDAVQRQKERMELGRERRSQARRVEDNERFPKQYKIEQSTLLSNLQREGLVVSVAQKDLFRKDCEKVAKRLEGDDANFAENMAKIDTTDELKMIIQKRYIDILSEKHDEDKAIREWLLEFHSQTVKALEKLTRIPPDLYISMFENVFQEIEENVKHSKDRNALIKHQEYMEQKRRNEEEQLKEILKVTEEQLKELNLSGRAAREIERRSVDQIRYPYEDTSPDRRGFSVQAEKELTEHFSQFFIQDKKQNLEEVKRETDDGTGNFDMSDDDCMEEKDTGMPSFPLPTKTKWPGSKWKNFEYAAESEEDDLVTVPTWRKELGYEERAPTYVGRHLTREQQQPLEEKRFKNRRKRNRNKIRFAEYDSPLNKMRIFIQPNDHFFASGDDGPTTDYVDMTLRDGSLYVHSVPGPFIVDYDLVGLPTRRRDCINDVAKQLKITNPALGSQYGEHHGNFLGRFWYDRMPNLARGSIEWLHQIERKKFGLLMQYTQEELQNMYSALAASAFTAMAPRHSLNEQRSSSDNMDNTERSKITKVAGVLLLTDWRLVYFDQNAITNAVLQYLPTNLGRLFFDTMAEYLIQLILDGAIEFHTIVFAFGGSPTFRKDDFLRFWKKLTVHTTKGYDVFWLAQDWCDGLQPTQDELGQLQDFNLFVENVFETMNKAGYRNYKWCDIRKEYNVDPIANEDTTDDFDPDVLQNLYYSYAQFFVNECNCYGFASFFKTNIPDQDDYATDDSRCPMAGLEYSRGVQQDIGDED